MDALYSFGFGHKFEDSDLFEHVKGNIPTQNYFNRYFGETGWRALTIRSLSIGQGEVLATPLQLANVMAIIANQGYYITPISIKRYDVVKKNVTADSNPYRYGRNVAGV